MKAIRWSDSDRYYGPFTYAPDSSYRNLAIMLGSGDADDYPGCRLRISIGKRTLIIALPAIIKPFRRWVDTSRYEWSKNPNGGYWDRHNREYGFSLSDGSLHVHYGEQTNEWPGAKSKVFFYPWREHRQIRHSLYDLKGQHFADLPEWGGLGNRSGWEVKSAIEAACPVELFEFADFDGERIVATCRIEEREWRRGKGLFRLFYLGRNRVKRSLDLSFSAEVGSRKGSWKGGTVGHSITMLPGERHEVAFRRYCDKQGLTFIAPAQGMSAGTAETLQAAQGEARQPGPKDAPQ